jgi:hypothetical protein
VASSKTISFLNLRVAEQRRNKGKVFFLTNPLNNHGWSGAGHARDPGGYLIEVGQYTQVALDWFRDRS